MKKKKNNVYSLNEEQVVFLRQLRLNEQYKKVLPKYKSMVTVSINHKKIINDKHLDGVIQAVKTISPELVGFLNLSTFNKNSKRKRKRNTKSKLIKIKPFKEIYKKDPLLTNQENHKKYLKSGVWKRKRCFLLKKRGCKCEMCKKKFKKEQLHIHHKTYRRWGAEYQNHLQVLCSSCHNKLHDKYAITELENKFSKGIKPKV